MNQMLNRNIIIIIAYSFLVIAPASCAGMFHPNCKDEVSNSELKKMGFSLDRYEKRELLLTQDDKAKIQELLGHPLTYYPKGWLTYYREIRRHHGEIGDIVPLYLETLYGKLVILVRINWDSIDKIVVVENIAKETKPVVNDAFLAQFLGKTASSSYKMVKTPQDLLTARENIRPIAGELAISQEIAEHLQELMVIHAVDKF